MRKRVRDRVRVRKIVRDRVSGKVPSHQSVTLYALLSVCVIMLHIRRHAEYGISFAYISLSLSKPVQSRKRRRLAGRPQRATRLLGRWRLLWDQTGQFDCRRGHKWCHVAVILALGRKQRRHVELVLVAIRELLRQTTQQRQGWRGSQEIAPHLYHWCSFNNR